MAKKRVAIGDAWCEDRRGRAMFRAVLDARYIKRGKNKGKIEVIAANNRRYIVERVKFYGQIKGMPHIQ